MSEDTTKNEDITKVEKASTIPFGVTDWEEGVFAISTKTLWIRRAISFLMLLSALSAFLEQIPGKVGIVAALVGGWLNRWLPSVLNEKKKVAD